MEGQRARPSTENENRLHFSSMDVSYFFIRGMGVEGPWAASYEILEATLRRPIYEFSGTPGERPP